MLAIESVLAKALPQEVIVLALGSEFHTYAEHDLWSKVRTQLSDLGLEDRIAAERLLFLSLQFPTAEKDNVLLHANLCHEVGHELVSPFRWADPFLSVLPGDEAIRALAKHIEPHDRYAGLSESEQRTVLANLVTRSGDHYWDSGVLANWLGELLADAVALCVLGPAAAFATAELLGLRLGLHRDRFGRTHPRWALRIELQRLHLEHVEADLSFGKLLEDHSEALTYLEHVHQEYLGEPGVVEEREFEQHGDFSIERTMTFYDALEQALRNKLPEILEAVRRSLASRDLLYTPEAFAGEVPALIEKLEAMLPPSSLGEFGSERPASYAGIMNAGALVRRDGLTRITNAVGRFRSREQENRGAGRYEAEELVFRLIRKAISDADIHRRWLAALETQ